MLIDNFFKSDVNGYTCRVQSFRQSSSDDCVVTRVTGQHDYGKSNADVLHLNTYNKAFKCFPKNLETFFINLDNIYFAKPQFSTLQRSDLQPFGSKLRKFWFFNTHLEVIPADLFEDTRNLEHIYLGENSIEYVGRGTFNKLHKLTALHFPNNPCHSGGIDSRAAVLNLIRKIENKCTDEGAFLRYKNHFTTTTEMPTTTKTCTNIDQGCSYQHSRQP